MFRIFTSASRLARPLHTRYVVPRAFSTSACRRATPAESMDFEKFANTQLYKALHNNPGAFQALNDFVQVLKTKGFIYTQPPTKVQMLKLAMDPAFRAAFKTMHEECLKVGVDMSSKEIQEELMTVMRTTTPGGEDGKQ